MTGGDAREQARQHRELASEDISNHTALRLDQDFVEAALIPACLVPGAIEHREPALVEEHARDHIEPFVAGRAGHAGKARQPLPLGQNLFGDNVKFGIRGRFRHRDQPL